ncbi:MAG: hypothetical protein ACT4O2_09850, partial [Beijerinckiaceae bacterium]
CVHLCAQPAIDNAVSIPIGRVASIGPMTAGRSAARAAFGRQPYGGTPKSGSALSALHALASALPEAPTDIFQFLMRFTGVPVAPGFFVMAGFMVALTSMAREGSGVPSSEITRRLIIRGLVLLVVDAVIMGLPRAAMGFIRPSC